MEWSPFVRHKQRHGTLSRTDFVRPPTTSGLQFDLLNLCCSEEGSYPCYTSAEAGRRKVVGGKALSTLQSLATRLVVGGDRTVRAARVPL